MSGYPTHAERALPAPPHGGWRRLRGWLLLQTLLLMLGLGSLLWNLLALLLYPLLPAASGQRLGRAAIARGYRLFWWVAQRSGMLQVDAQALDALRADAGLIVVANHPSMLDALLLVSRLPASFCIMKASLMRNPLLGPGARLARYIANDTPSGTVRRAVQALKAGGQLVLFPEGTRTTSAPVNRFRPGATAIAARAGVPIQTVFIDTRSPYLCKGWPLWRLPPLPICFSVRLGQRFAPAADPAAQLAELQAYFASQLPASAHPVLPAASGDA